MLIYIKSIVVVSMNNNKFLAISTDINKDLFNILPLYKNTRLKLKKKIKHKHYKNLSTTITQGLLIRPTRKKNKKQILSNL